MQLANRMTVASGRVRCGRVQALGAYHRPARRPSRIAAGEVPEALSHDMTQRTKRCPRALQRPLMRLLNGVLSRWTHHGTVGRVLRTHGTPTA